MMTIHRECVDFSFNQGQFLGRVQGFRSGAIYFCHVFADAMCTEVARASSKDSGALDGFMQMFNDTFKFNNIFNKRMVVCVGAFPGNRMDE